VKGASVDNLILIYYRGLVGYASVFDLDTCHVRETKDELIIRIPNNQGLLRVDDSDDLIEPYIADDH
jgi:hypothetical protein